MALVYCFGSGLSEGGRVGEESGGETRFNLIFNIFNFNLSQGTLIRELLTF